MHGADVLLKDLPPVARVIGDQGYDSNKIRKMLAQQGITPCIMPRRCRKKPVHYSKRLYCKRHKIETLFSRQRDWRRLATCYDGGVHVFRTTGVTLSRSSTSDPITVTEAPSPNHTESYRLSMTAQPAGGSLSIAVASSDPTAATVSPATVTFTPSNWDTPQTVTVTGVDDGVDQSGNRTVTITHTTTSDNGRYRNLAISHVLATVVDNDMEVSITADDHDGTITEGEAAHFTLTATPAPAAEQTIDVNVRITDSSQFAVSSQVGRRVFTITASGTVSFSIPTEDDMHPEGDGRITATVETDPTAAMPPHPSPSQIILMLYPRTLPSSPP